LNCRDRDSYGLCFENVAIALKILPSLGDGWGRSSEAGWVHVGAATEGHLVVQGLADNRNDVGVDEKAVPCWAAATSFVRN
jgi:hypothetical protein